MISIKKPQETPAALESAQQEIEVTLIEKCFGKEKPAFKWEGRHYSDPIKKDLEKLYHNKCGFCEQKMTETGETKFTVEHFRNKSHYWWLGNEWTNLFPTCVKCNGFKGDEFDVNRKDNKSKQIKEVAPIIETPDGQKIDRNRCKADCPELRAEMPLFLHPEVDRPEEYFVFDRNGEIKPSPEALADPYKKARAEKMIGKFLKREGLLIRRKQLYEIYKKQWTQLLISYFKYPPETDSDQDLKRHFSPFFEGLLMAANPASEFSLMGTQMLSGFDAFFLEVCDGEEVKKLVLYAFSLFLESKRK